MQRTAAREQDPKTLSRRRAPLKCKLPPHPPHTLQQAMVGAAESQNHKTITRATTNAADAEWAIAEFKITDVDAAATELVPVDLG